MSEGSGEATLGRRVLLGAGAAIFSAIGSALALRLVLGPNAVHAFFALILFVGALIGFLVWYFAIPRETAGQLSRNRVFRSALIGGGLGAWSLVSFVRSALAFRSCDWPLLGFALVGFAWCGGWLVYSTRAR